MTNTLISFHILECGIYQKKDGNWACLNALLNPKIWIEQKPNQEPINHIPEILHQLNIMPGDTWIDIKSTLRRFYKEATKNSGIVRPQTAIIFQEQLHKIIEFLLEYYKKNILQSREKITDLHKIVFGNELLPMRLIHLCEWIKNSNKHGMSPYLLNYDFYTTQNISKREIYAKVNKTLLVAGKKLNITVYNVFDGEEMHVRTIAEIIIGQGKMILGHDRWFTKTIFAALPFFLLKKTDDTRWMSNTSKPFYRAVSTFLKWDSLQEEKHNIRKKEILNLVPPFVSFPHTTQITQMLVNFIQEELKGKAQKLIVKGEFTAANGKENPYLILDTRDTWDWRQKIKQYVDGYARKTKSTIMIQCWVNNLTDKGKLQLSETKKHNFIGGKTEKHGISYIFHFIKKEFNKKETKHIKDKRVIESIKISEEPSHKHKPAHEQKNLDEKGIIAELKLAEKYLGLVSPIGAHALDYMIGRLKGDTEPHVYLLEANPSKARGDSIHTSKQTKKNMFYEYTQWAKSQVIKKTKKTPWDAVNFADLGAKDRREYLKDIHNLAADLKKELNSKIIVCDENGYREVQI